MNKRKGVLGRGESWPGIGNSGPGFLDASSHLYMRVCPSVRPSVGPLVGWSVRRSVGLLVTRYFSSVKINRNQSITLSQASWGPSIMFTTHHHHQPLLFLLLLATLNLLSGRIVVSTGTSLVIPVDQMSVYVCRSLDRPTNLLLNLRNRD